MMVAKKRADKEKTEARVNSLVRILLDGANERWDIPEFIREQQSQDGSPWFLGEGESPLTYSQTRRYISRAKILLAKAGQGERQELLQRAIAQRDHLYAKSVAMGDVRSALAVLDSRDRLLRLFPREEARPNPPGDGRTVLTVIEQLVVNNQAPPPGLLTEAPAIPVLELTQEIEHHAHGTNGKPIPAQGSQVAPCPAALSQ